MKIPFNQTYLGNKTLEHLSQSLGTQHLSGDGPFTIQCQRFLEETYSFKKTLLTTSCTHSLEMAALLLDIHEGDEVILPSYTFVSTANAFILQGANVVFIDSKPTHPNMDESLLEGLITPRTKTIVPVHYGGVSCNMDTILDIARNHHINVIEDAAQGIHAFYKGKALGSLGDIGCLSFHDSKNISSGEGGLISLNTIGLKNRAEIIREKGTNRSAFFRGEVDKYGWVSKGSSYLPSDLLAALLWSQLEEIDSIHKKRKQAWAYYMEKLTPLKEKGMVELPEIPEYADHNAHIFYMVMESLEQRTHLIRTLKKKGISATFHYLALHESNYFKEQYHGKPLVESIKYTDRLVRLPLFNAITTEQLDTVIQAIYQFFGHHALS